MSVNPYAQKLAVAIGLLKSKTSQGKCEVKHCRGCKHCVAVQIIPIDKIDGVKVGCNIKVQQKRVLFCAESDFKYISEMDELPDLYYKMKYRETGITSDDILEFTTSLLGEIPLLRLTYDGNLEVPDNIKSTVLKTIDDVFASIACPNVATSCMQECSVCYEKTNTKTPCKHCLCNRCWSNIEKDCDGEIPCPLCRENIYNI
jgi:hypothetical protein